MRQSRAGEVGITWYLPNYMIKRHSNGALVVSPATPCTFITPIGAPHGLISRICFLPFTGAHAGVCFRIVMPSYLSTLHLVSHTDALYTESPLEHRLA